MIKQLTTISLLTLLTFMVAPEYLQREAYIKWYKEDTRQRAKYGLPPIRVSSTVCISQESCLSGQMRKKVKKYYKETNDK